MIKIITKEIKPLDEARTVQADKKLANDIAEVYNVSFLSLVRAYLNYKHENKLKILKDKDISKIKNTNIYKDTLEKLTSKYSDLFAKKSPINEKQFKLNLSNNLQNQVKYKIFYIANTDIGQYVVKQNTSLKAFKSAGLKKDTVLQQIPELLDQSGFKGTTFYLELIEGKSHSGLIDLDNLTITIKHGDAIFRKVLLLEKDAAEFISVIDKQLAETKTIVYHELQHLFINITRDLTGFKTFGFSPRSTYRGDVPDNDPEEVQTSAQEIITLFNDMMEIFGKQNKKFKSEQLREIKKLLLKKSVGINMTAEEQSAFNLLNTESIKKYFEYIKERLNWINKYNQEMYKYTLKTLFSSISGTIKEEIIVNKIKIILSENQQILSEELSKDEIRKLIRDELEKMLRDKETKKEIAKISKELVKKLYRELSFSSTHIIDQIDV
jgi:hypothetical protein